MKFRHTETKKTDALQGTATIVGEAEPGKYIIISCAHNFKLLEHDFVAAMFFLQREGHKEYKAAFKVIPDTVRVYPKFDVEAANDFEIFSGFDIGLAVVEFSKGNKDQIPKEFPKL